MATERSLHRATCVDAGAIAALHAASWRLAYRNALSDHYLNGDVLTERVAYWTKWLNSPSADDYVLLLKQSDNLIGFACAQLDHDPTWGSLLDNLHIAEAFQGQGRGKQLMQAVATHCLQQAQHRGLYLWVLAVNYPAQQFYRRLGATQVEASIWHSPDGGEIAKLRYVWRDVSALTTL